MSARKGAGRHISLRLEGYDYSAPGAYFVTIVTRRRAWLFGEVVEGVMKLNEAGEIAAECWRVIPDHFPQVELDAFVVMPNHVHGIVVIHENNGLLVGSRHAAIPQAGHVPWKPPVNGGSGSLGAIIRSFKSAVSRRAGQTLSLRNIWQSSYHDHIIRNEYEWGKIRNYIELNPRRWKTDRQNS